jgi:Phosphoinositide phospholipase C, Ca2+-dependent
LKVLHLQDIDFETHCLTFIGCLETLASWSRAHPFHVPILVMVEAKQDPIADPLGLGFVVPLEFGAPELDGLDAEIRSVFSEDDLITPDLVRGAEASLEGAISSRGWPRLSEIRGRVMFTFLNGDAARERYVQGHPALRGRVMFTTTPSGQPEAAFFNVNDSLVDGAEIRARVLAGYLVRTRADIDTRQARSGSTALREAALASGAQFVSTDYVVPDADFGTGYHVELPGGFSARCNPVTALPECGALQLSLQPLEL